MTGCPNTNIPSPNTVWHDIKAAYVKCHKHITKLCQDHPGQIHIVIDAWTLTNHHAFAAWMVHLEHEGCMLAFLWDIVEVLESHTG
ncbi:hypothetical protein L208DRAFT_1252261 [Tricholoma matsutake]|nr:hypothetical protein L208DRAFT_1252261 [Tricholoma matsutake 945]